MGDNRRSPGLADLRRRALKTFETGRCQPAGLDRCYQDLVTKGRLQYPLPNAETSRIF